MRLFILLIIFIIINSNSILIGQHLIGNTTIDFNDPNRNRDIETHIYYPATTTGTNTTPDTGQYPLVIIGHGYQIGYDSYQYLWEHLVPLGYIVALPATETGLFPSHGTFGEDLRYLVTAFEGANTDNTSLFYQKMKGTSAIMGHSMGGGASFLAVENDTLVTTMVSFAAAETNPSAITAANSTFIPTLTFIGDEDCVAAPVGNQLDMYNNLEDCKAYATILGGSHCQFANSNTVCELGELFCNSSNFITEQAQHDAITTLLTPWLGAWLYEDYSAWTTFDSLLGNGTDYSLEMICSTNAPQPPVIDSTNNPPTWVDQTPDNKLFEVNQNTNGEIFVRTYCQEPIYYHLFDPMGRLLKQAEVNHAYFSLSLMNFPSGIYILQLRQGSRYQSEKIIR
ncbi:MAG: T9SS type A sorting domain-containing protein [Saprospiraceae bacterium]|nr:T9SS type A sorting domain-containing protein [Saprospiraceae bacterium]